MIRSYLLIILLFFCTPFGCAQSTTVSQNMSLSFEEYIGFIKTYHPVLKQAALTLSVAEANLLKARGGFDPKVAIDFDQKQFKSTEYFDQLNATFKIPTWYGIELKGAFEKNSGAFLNPNLTVPEDGLYSAGVSFSLAQGLLINNRMAALKKAKIFKEQSKTTQTLITNTLLFEASTAYFRWLESSTEKQIYQTFLKNAEARFQGIKRSVELGEKASIDSIEAKIALQSRKLKLEEVTLKNSKAQLFVSNYLWLNGTPLVIKGTTTPIPPTLTRVKDMLTANTVLDTIGFLENHPKLLDYRFKIAALEIDKRLKRNKLLPKIAAQYNFLTPQVTQLTNFTTENYKAFVTMSLPLFLRKERGDLKLASLKLQDANFERLSTSLRIRNKVAAEKQAVSSIKKQYSLASEMVINYQTMLNAENRKFNLGESSLFLINTREQKLIAASLKKNALQFKQLNTLVGLFKTMGILQLSE